MQKTEQWYKNPICFNAVFSLIAFTMADSISVTIGIPFIFFTKEERVLKKCSCVSLNFLSWIRNRPATKGLASKITCLKTKGDTSNSPKLNVVS